jgi:PHP family Zn ribbon phosphoesterase
MENYVIKNCKGCHQPLRIPADIGGMLMRCPSCGNEFHTDFKLGAIVREGGDGKKPAQKTPTKRPSSTFKIIV